MKESWVDVKGYEGKYIISNKGRVACVRGKKRKILKTFISPKGYKKINLSDDVGKRKQFFVHRLVAKHFMDDFKEEYVVNHKDGKKNNPKQDNLEICTQQENIIHAVQVLLKIAKPVQCFDRITSELLGEYPSIKVASEETRVCYAGVQKVCNYQRNHAGGFVFRFKKKG